MKFGMFYFPTDYGIQMPELAPAIEQRGIEALFVCEHTHIPSSRKTPFPGGGELPKKYIHTHDPFIALAFAAAANATRSSTSNAKCIKSGCTFTGSAPGGIWHSSISSPKNSSGR